jgi:hypothetical protein
MKLTRFLLLQTVIAYSLTSSALALPTIYDWAFHVDGVTYENFSGDSMPANSGQLDGDTGLGTISWDIDTPGTHSFIAFFDFQFTDGDNPHNNEYGETVGTQSSGQSWEIDEPSYVFGDIYDNLSDGTLDNYNAVSSGMEDDVSFAIGWDFTLSEGEQAIVTLVLSQVLPDIAFYLAHRDLQSGEGVYFSSTLELSSVGDTPPAPVPEPATIVLFSASLAVLCVVERKKLLL